MQSLLAARPGAWGAPAFSSSTQRGAGGQPRPPAPLAGQWCRVHASAGGQQPPGGAGAASRRARRPERQAPDQPQSNNIVAKRLPSTQDAAEVASAPRWAEPGREGGVGRGAKAPAAAGPAQGASPRLRSSLVVRQWPAPLDGVAHPMGMVVGSAWLLSVAVQLTGAAALTPLWLPVVAGGLVGGLASAAHGHGMRRLWRSPASPLRVLITGGSSGVGKALAREFLRCGDSVVVTSRSLAGAAAAAQQLADEVGVEGSRIMGLECDVGDPASVDALMEAAPALLGGAVDAVINNAGHSGSFQSLLRQSPEQVVRVVRTNLTGSLLVTRAAMRLMARQPSGGHIFNTEGAGSDGGPTPQYAAYGATKCAIAQLRRTLQHEAAALPSPVRVHNLSPGMVLTPLLLEGATLESKQVFNILCEHPETVAAFLVPRVRTVVARGNRGAAIRYLTPTRALAKFLTAPLRTGRYFDRDGRPLYAPERDRLLGAAQAKRTARRQRAAARRSVPLQLAYSLGMALSFLLIVNDALAKGPAGLGQ